MLVITRVRRTQTRKMPTGPEVRPRPRTPEKFSPDSDLHWILEGKRAFCFRSRYGQTHPITHLQKDSNSPPRSMFPKKNPAIFPAAAFHFHVKVATTWHPTRPRCKSQCGHLLAMYLGESPLTFFSFLNCKMGMMHKVALSIQFKIIWHVLETDT